MNMNDHVLLESWHGYSLPSHGRVMCPHTPCVRRTRHNRIHNAELTKRRIVQGDNLQRSKLGGRGDECRKSRIGGNKRGKARRSEQCIHTSMSGGLASPQVQILSDTCYVATISHRSNSWSVHHHNHVRASKGLSFRVMGNPCREGTSVQARLCASSRSGRVRLPYILRTGLRTALAIARTRAHNRNRNPRNGSSTKLTYGCAHQFFMIVCVNRLQYLLKGWYLVQKNDHPYLLISQYEDMEDALHWCRFVLSTLTISQLPTMEQLIQALKQHDEELAT